MAQSTDQDKRARRARKRVRRALYDQCRAAEITHDAIAIEARCHRTSVVHFFSGRRSPRAVELAIEKLLAAQNGQRRSA